MHLKALVAFQYLEGYVSYTARVESRRNCLVKSILEMQASLYKRQAGYCYLHESLLSLMQRQIFILCKVDLYKRIPRRRAVDFIFDNSPFVQISSCNFLKADFDAVC